MGTLHAGELRYGAQMISLNCASVKQRYGRDDLKMAPFRRVDAH